MKRITIDLPEDIDLLYGVTALKQGTKKKKYIETFLIDNAKNLKK